MDKGDRVVTLETMLEELVDREGTLGGMVDDQVEMVDKEVTLEIGEAELVDKEETLETEMDALDKMVDKEVEFENESGLSCENCGQGGNQ